MAVGRRRTCGQPGGDAGDDGQDGDRRSETHRIKRSDSEQQAADYLADRQHQWDTGKTTEHKREARFPQDQGRKSSLPIFIGLHGPQAHVNSCESRPEW
jgi:hypothetical protein